MLNTFCLGDKSLPPLVFLHGLLGSFHDFIPMMHELKHHFYCIGIDLPGHGSSDIIDPLSFKIALKAIVDAIAHHTSFPVSMIGYSLGGRLALLLHHEYPALIDRLVILSAHPGITSEEIPSLLVRENYWISLLKTDLNKFLFLWYKQPLFHTLKQEEIIKKRAHIQGAPIAAAMEALSLSKQPSLWVYLTDMMASSLWLYGAEDAKYKALYRRLPAPIIRLAIPYASHAIHIENPIKCSNSIKDFFNINY